MGETETSTGNITEDLFCSHRQDVHHTQDSQMRSGVPEQVEFLTSQGLLPQNGFLLEIEKATQLRMIMSVPTSSPNRQTNEPVTSHYHPTAEMLGQLIGEGLDLQGTMKPYQQEPRGTGEEKTMSRVPEEIHYKGKGKFNMLFNNAHLLMTGSSGERKQRLNLSQEKIK